MMNKLLTYILAAVYPERCPYCDQTVTVGTLVCDECKKHLPDTIQECYAKGGFPCAAPFAYKGVFAEAVKRFKFKGCPDYAPKLGYQLSQAIKTAFKDSDFNYVTCVPMHKKQLKARGYNQSKLLAKEVSRNLGIPYINMLKKIKENNPQHNLSTYQKRDNVKGVYKAINTDKIKGNNILVVDDIITTGYTLGECCRILRKAKANNIRCAAVCAKIIR